MSAPSWITTLESELRRLGFAPARRARHVVYWSLERNGDTYEVILPNDASTLGVDAPLARAIRKRAETVFSALQARHTNYVAERRREITTPGMRPSETDAMQPLGPAQWEMLTHPLMGATAPRTPETVQEEKPEMPSAKQKMMSKSICMDCVPPFNAKNPAGLGAHRWAKHGYKSQRYAAERVRAGAPAHGVKAPASSQHAKVQELYDTATAALGALRDALTVIERERDEAVEVLGTLKRRFTSALRELGDEPSDGA